MKQILPLVIFAVFLPSCSSLPRIEKQLSAIDAEMEADRARYSRKEITAAQYRENINSRNERRRTLKDLYVVQYEKEEKAKRILAAIAASAPDHSSTPTYVSTPTYTPSYRSSLTSPSPYSGSSLTRSSSSLGGSRSTYDSDYRVSNTLGGGVRVSDRYGNSETYSQNLGGGYRSTSNTGRTTTYSQTLGGGTRATSSDGTTYSGTQTLGGGYKVTDNKGNTYTRTQTLGGGNRYDRN